MGYMLLLEVQRIPIMHGRSISRLELPSPALLRRFAMLTGISTLPSPDGGVYVCAGHGPWGISLSLGTGKVLSEMLEGKGQRELSTDVRSLGMQ